MRIRDVRINGIKNPVGYSFSNITISWKVETETEKNQEEALVVVATDASFEAPVLRRKGKLSSTGEVLDLKPSPRTRYYVKVVVTSDSGKVAESDTAFFETAKMDEPFEGKWITNGDETYHPVFFKNIPLEKELSSARMYVTGLGLYEVHIGGEKAGDEYLAPYSSDYRDLVQYQTLDITDMVKSGDNLVEIFTGNGFYKGRLGYEGAKEVFGDRFRALAEIRLTYADGSEAIYGTDESWSYKGSDVQYSDIYDGECIDRTLYDGKENPALPAKLFDEKDSVIDVVERYSIPVVVKDTLPVKEIIHTPAGETVIDFGQNFSGYVEYEADFPKGTHIVLEHGEILQDGNFYRDNYRSAKAKMEYISGGNKETVRAHFTYFGFRYAKVTGFPGEVTPEMFKGRVLYSDLDTTIHVETDNALLERLFKNTYWGQRSNFVDMPTDCPQRDERLGWTGDAQVFSGTACFNMDTRAFYGKFLTDLYHDQKRHNGSVPNYLPNYTNMEEGACVWGDVATFLPMTMFEHYGDLTELTRRYPMMKAWVDFIIAGDEKNGGHNLWDFGFHFGDWLAMDGMTAQSMKGGTEDYFIASIYYYASVKKTSDAAALIGRKKESEEYGKKAEKIYDAILNEYFTQTGRLSIDTQTAYLISLKFGVYRDKVRIIEALKKRIQKDAYKIKGGFVGATMLCSVLAQEGLEDLAYYFLFQEGFPGWMHCINLGATTIWERWNSVLDDGKISGTGMNSLNHYSYGSVMEFVYKYAAGIKPADPGFKSVEFAPKPSWRMKKLKVSYDSVCGTYTSGWELHDNGEITVVFEVPFGGKATALLPGTDGEKVELTAGRFEKRYKPDRNYLVKYSMDTSMLQLLEDREALEILKEDLAPAYKLYTDDEVEFMSMKFSELQFLFFRGLNPGVVATGTKRLFELQGGK